jgi:hypothetical protein
MLNARFQDVSGVHPGARSKSLHHQERCARTEEIENDKSHQPHVMLMADMTQSLEQIGIEMHLLCGLDRRRV